MCRVFDTNKASFYAWLHNSLSDRAIEDERLLTLIRASHTSSGRVTARGVYLLTYGKRVSAAVVIQSPESCRSTKIKAQRRYKAPRAVHGRPSILAPNTLNREFTVDAPDKVWMTDITYIRTSQGWLDLAVVLDLYTRKVVGWSMKPTIAKELVLDALLMAVWHRKPTRKVCALGSRQSIRQ